MTAAIAAVGGVIIVLFAVAWHDAARPLVRAVVRVIAVLFVAALFMAGIAASRSELAVEQTKAARLAEEGTMLLINTRSASDRAAALESQVRDLEYALSQARQSASLREQTLQEKLDDVQRNAEEAAKQIADISRVRDGLLITLASDVLFDSGRSELKCGEREKLSRLIPWMQFQALEHPIRLRLTGHTDDEGPDSLNDPLSFSRAKAVGDYLAANGIPSDWLNPPVGRGRRQPKGFTEPQSAAVIKTQNRDPEQRSRNRRVEILVSERDQ